MEHKAAESAVVGLCVSLEAVEDMVNHALLKIIDVSQHPGSRTFSAPHAHLKRQREPSSRATAVSLPNVRPVTSIAMSNQIRATPLVAKVPGL
jgi:hypothetical protein